MKFIIKAFLIAIFVFSNYNLIFAQKDTVNTAVNDSVTKANDSINNELLSNLNKKLAEIEQQRIDDSLKRVALESKLNSLKTTDNLKKEELQKQLQEIFDREADRIKSKKSKIDSLRFNSKGNPVLGILNDTLFFIYAKIGASIPRERASNITKKIFKLYDDDFMKIDSLTYINSENTIDIIYGESIIISISETDAFWENMTLQETANHHLKVIKNSIINAKKENSLSKLISRIGLAVLILFGVWLLIWLIGKAFNKLLVYVDKRKSKWLKNLSYKDYTFLSADQEYKLVLFTLKVFKWFTFVLILYIAFPLLFSIFPFTRGWANSLFDLIWTPFKAVFIAVWDYLPNLFSIAVIVIVMKYFIRFVKYIFSEIETEKLKINKFHSDWAMPTYSIVKFLLQAFMFVLIFPYLPGSNSDIFKGVSVFIGVLFSLGSSSAISNMVAGLVITYMRPFKIGDRIKIGDITGDVVEKTLLVTRLKTIKNEEVTIPNSSVLSGNTTNYSSYAKQEGLIIHTTVTIGYDVPWKKMHDVLLQSAFKTEFILKEPKPFVLQTSLDDFYVSYQLNAYIKDANKQALIYSNLHQNIQDCCNENGIEILSPHYRAARDGNMTTIPSEYLDKDYKAPSFNIRNNCDN